MKDIHSQNIHEFLNSKPRTRENTKDTKKEKLLEDLASIFNENIIFLSQREREKGRTGTGPCCLSPNHLRLCVL